MKTLNILCAMLAIAALASPLWAQGWEWQNPHVTGNDLTGIGFVNATTGWATSSGGELLWTNDAGAHWSVRSRTTYYFYRTVFTDTQNGWSVPWMGHEVLHTSDGGFTWTAQCDHPDAEFMDVTFLDANHGWVAGNNSACTAGLILKTEDGGATWVEQPHDSVNQLNEVCFINLQEGWAGQVWSLLHTTDGGETWTRLPVQFPGYAGLSFQGSNNGWTVGFNDVFRTTDGGATWDPQGFNFDFDHRVRAMASPNDSTVWLVGNEGEMYVTHNSGAHWDTLASGMTETFLTACFLNGTTGWVAGGTGTILHTENGGESWLTQGGNPATGDVHLTDVEFSDLDHGWAVGSGEILRTENGGGMWTVADVPEAANSITAIDAQTAVATAPDGRVLRTTNGGAGWNAISVSGAAWTGYIVHVGGSHLWTFGSPSSVYFSTDAGETWSGSDIGNYHYCLGMSFPDSMHGWIAGGDDEMGAFIVHTTDAGQTWAEQFFDLYGSALTDVSFVDSLHGWVSCWTGQVMRTEDGGLTWDTLATPQLELNGIQFVDNLNGWAFSDYEQTSRTTDGGLTWQHFDTGTLNRIENIYFVDPENGWAVGMSGTILHRTGPEGTVPRRAASLAGAYGIRAFPNPFNPNTTLSFDVPASRRVQLSIYDITGRLVQTLADRVFSQGNHRIEFDGSSLPSGMYFARMQGNHFSKTQKLVLLK